MGKIFTAPPEPVQRQLERYLEKNRPKHRRVSIVFLNYKDAYYITFEIPDSHTKTGWSRESLVLASDGTRLT